MWRIGHRRVGVVTLAVLVLLDAAFSFMGAFSTLASDAFDWTAALLSVVVGVLLTIKAYGLWSYHRAAWFSVQVLAGVGAAGEAIEVVRGHAESGAWFSLGFHLLTLVYLNLPSVRALYLHRIDSTS